MSELRLSLHKGHRSWIFALGIALVLAATAGAPLAVAQDGAEAAAEEVEAISSSTCADCHDQSKHGSAYLDDLSLSIHEGLECLDCHQDRGTMPHQEQEGVSVGSEPLWCWMP